MKKLLCLSLSLCLSSALSAQAQGLLGQKYVSAGYVASSPNSDILRAVSQWSHGLDVQMRRPITKTFDWIVDADFTWYGGSTVSGTTPIEFDFDLAVLSTSISYHTPHGGIFSSFLNVGISYANLNSEASSGIVAMSDSEDEIDFHTQSGMEIRITESTALLASVNFDDSFFDSEADDDFLDSLDFQGDLVHWWSPHFFSGFLIGSDFDNTEITLGGYLGIGNW